jgi:predicted Na+-dependent transporter
MINILFENDDTIGMKSLPLLVYHQVQLIAAALLITKLKSWIQSEPTAGEQESLTQNERKLSH